MSKLRKIRREADPIVKDLLSLIMNKIADITIEMMKCRIDLRKSVN